MTMTGSKINPSNRATRALRLSILAIVVYVASSMAAYRFRHPELTDTQLFLHMWSALSWQP